MRMSLDILDRWVLGWRRLMLGVWLLLLLPQALWAAPEFLPPEQAFRLRPRLIDARTIGLRFEVAPGYYLYRERLSFQAQPEDVALGAVQLPPGQVKFDETFQKNVETYHGSLEVRLPVVAAPAEFLLKVSSQGCADQGLCYPPQVQVIQLTVREGGLQALRTLNAEAAAAWVAPVGAIQQTLTASVSAAPEERAQDTASSRSDDTLVAALNSGRLWPVLGLFLMAGLLLSFTPCMLPMLPILSSIIVGQGKVGARWRGLGLSAAYVLGMALVYTALGVAAGLAGEGLAATLQQPAVLWVFAGLLSVLALSMLDAYELRLPAAWQTRLSTASAQLPGGQTLGVFLMGGLSALIVSPCVAAPLAGALLYISQTRDAVLGGLALFALAVGMGLPLLLVAGSAASLLPRAGAWMASVKHFFGVMLLGTALWLLGPVLAAWVQMLLWALLLCSCGAALMGLRDAPGAMAPWRRGVQGLGMVLVLGAGALVAGALSGGQDPWQPLRHWGLANGAPTSAPLPFQAIKGVVALDDILKEADRPVMLDFYADWCVSCKEMERYTFSDTQVQSHLRRMILLRADVSANDAQDRALLKRFNLFGPPGILFFAPGGQELMPARVVGFQDAEAFLRSLGKVVP